MSVRPAPLVPQELAVMSRIKACGVIGNDLRAKAGRLLFTGLVEETPHGHRLTAEGERLLRAGLAAAPTAKPASRRPRLSGSTL